MLPVISTLSCRIELGCFTDGSLGLVDFRRVVDIGIKRQVASLFIDDSLHWDDTFRCCSIFAGTENEVVDAMVGSESFCCEVTMLHRSRKVESSSTRCMSTQNFADIRC